MNVEDFVEKQKEIQIQILEFLDDSIENQDILQKLANYNLSKDQKELTTILYFIVNICNNHQRLGSFFSKIEKILQFYKNDIQQHITNFEIFHIFQSNKRILLFLIEEKILILDQNIIDNFEIMNSSKYEYQEYFKPELGEFILDLEIFNKNREIGENDSYICELIRNDSIIEFIKYVNKTNTSLSSIIKPSIFETNLLLLRNNVSLIEYSLFFGSIQIFQYLLLNNVQIGSNLWPYAIHGRNAEIIHILEENKIEPNIDCIKESIKCHHNEITDYFLINYANESMNENSYLYASIKYYNFEYFPKSLNDNFLFYYLCEYDYYFLVEMILKTGEININYKKRTKYEQKYYLFISDEKPLYFTSIAAASKKMNFDILHLLLEQENVEIGDFCFYGCNLSYFSIPSCVKSIGNHAFENCKLLKEILIPSSVTSIGYSAFSDCRSLEYISIPSLVTSIKNNSFYYCSSLSQITIPSSFTSIENHAFYHCSSLTQITVPSSLNSIEDFAFKECSLLKQFLVYSAESSSDKSSSNSSSLGFEVFYDCSSLTHVSIPSKITIIDKCAFYSNSFLKEVLISSSVIIINDSAFSGCSSLKQIIIPSLVFFIGGYAFSNCTSLTQIKIPSSVKKIKRRTFANCSSLKEIIFDEQSSITSFGKYAFFKCSSLEKIKIPPSLEIIKRGCFAKCSALVNITIPSSVENIDCFTFNGCLSLEDVCLSSSLKCIQKCTFKNCVSLKRITIPSSVEKIDSYAFANCQSLSEAIILPSNAIIEDFAFPSQTIVIQCCCIEKNEEEEENNVSTEDFARIFRELISRHWNDF